MTTRYEYSRKPRKCPACKESPVATILRDRQPHIKERFGIQRIGIFGSYARNNMTTDSDIDVVVEMPPDIFGMVHLKAYLEEELQHKVDLVRYRKKMNNFLKDRIDSEAIYV